MDGISITRGSDRRYGLQVPRPPRKDFYKLMSRDHIVLRFAIRLDATAGYSLSETDRLAACNSHG